MLAHPGLDFIAARQPVGLVAMLAQVVAQHLGNLVFVLDNEDPGGSPFVTHARESAASGSRMHHRSPPRADCVACMRPPCALTMACTMARPRPLPPLLLERAASTRYSRSVSRGRSASPTPGEESSQSMRAWLPSTPMRIFRRPGASL